VVGNYLKGETPPPFDLLYWNSDSTNLPGPFYAWYLRNTYLENNLIKPGKCTVCGEKVDLTRSIFRSTSTARAKTTSCRSAAPMHHPGPARQEALRHGRVRPYRRRDQPARLPKKRSHWMREDGKLPKPMSMSGSPAPPNCPAAGGPTGRLAQEPRRQAGRGAQDLWQGPKYKAIEPAPGRYVKAKA
jgi:polyhydroxyalkanoate synthase